MRTEFVKSTLLNLKKKQILKPNTSILTVCAGLAEKDLFSSLMFTQVVISNLDSRMQAEQFKPYQWSYQDAQNLTFDDNSYDFVFVADGLHHCASPHRAMLEMYRVARKGIIVIESRDSLLMRTANRLGLSPEYELEAVIGNDFTFGGKDNTQIPNFIYRWTERDFKKAVNSFNPIGRHGFHFYYNANLPYHAVDFQKTNFRYYLFRALDPFVKVLSKLFKKQSNSFAMVAIKPHVPDALWPWLHLKGNEIVFDKRYAEEHFKA